MNTIHFNKEKFSFAKLIKNYLDVDHLTNIKAKNDNELKEGNSIYKNMEQTDYYDKLNTKLNSKKGKPFYTLFDQFVAEVIRPRYNEPIIYQKTPTHRIHFSNSSGSARFHKDMDYGHHRCEINYTVPQTPMYGTNSIWIESEEDKGDYEPMEAEVGEVMEFKGAYLSHGAKHNRTGDTRVSFDFRVMPYSEAPAVYKDRSSWLKYDSEHPLFKEFSDFGFCKDIPKAGSETLTG